MDFFDDNYNDDNLPLRPSDEFPARFLDGWEDLPQAEFIKDFDWSCLNGNDED